MFWRYLVLYIQSMEKNETKISDQSNKGYASEIELFRSLVGDSDAECLKGLIDQVASGIEDDVSPIVLSSSSDKSHRTVVLTFLSIMYVCISIMYESIYLSVGQPIFLKA